MLFLLAAFVFLYFFIKKDVQYYSQNIKIMTSAAQ